jgi:BMFP domain-containing protein YqiC
MAKKKRKMFDSPEERAAFFARWEENTRRLEARIKKLEAELAAKRKPQSQS